jgi:hypothetical protein
LPSTVRKQEQSDVVISLTETIKQVCKGSNLSYAEINKALYLSDTELYAETIGLL